MCSSDLRSPSAQVPWVYQAHRPDVDHFNREFQPERAKGGVQIARLDIATDAQQALTPLRDGTWDFRASASPDGTRLLFCRAETGASPGVWVADAGGADARRVTSGLDGEGADHPRWVPHIG